MKKINTNQSVLVNLCEDLGYNHFHPDYFKNNELDKDTWLMEMTLLQKWLRDNHNVHVLIDCNASGWFWELYKTNGTSISSFEDAGPNAAGQWDTYEESLEVGLIEAIEIIKEQKNKNNL